MPGITGFIHFVHIIENSKPILETLIQPLMHYPWYQVERLYVQNVAVALVHAGIINHNVLFSSNRGIHVLLHGEIYNDDIAGRSQTEYIEKEYQEKGNLFAKDLNGSLAVALLDEHQNRMFLATDRIGSKPIIYYRDQERLFFAPELKSILKIPGVSFLKACIASISDVLSNGFITNRRTLIENVRFLDRASVLEISAGDINIHSYWQYNFDESVKDIRARDY